MSESTEPLSKQAERLRLTMEERIEQLRSDALGEIRRRVGHRMLPPFTPEACMLIREYALTAMGSKWPLCDMKVEPVFDYCDEASDETVLMTKCYTDCAWVDIVQSLLHPDIEADNYNSDVSTTGTFEETEYLASRGMPIFTGRDFESILMEETADCLGGDRLNMPDIDDYDDDDWDKDDEEFPQFELKVTIVSCGNFDVEIVNVSNYYWRQKTHDTLVQYWTKRIADILEKRFVKYYMSTQMGNVVQFRGVKVPIDE